MPLNYFNLFKTCTSAFWNIYFLFLNPFVLKKTSEMLVIVNMLDSSRLIFNPFKSGHRVSFYFRNKLIHCFFFCFSSGFKNIHINSICKAQILWFFLYQLSGVFIDRFYPGKSSICCLATDLWKLFFPTVGELSGYAVVLWYFHSITARGINSYRDFLDMSQNTFSPFFFLHWPNNSSHSSMTLFFKDS